VLASVFADPLPAMLGFWLFQKVILRCGKSPVSAPLEISSSLPVRLLPALPEFNPRLNLIPTSAKFILF
jgi:hypothetical protein